MRDPITPADDVTLLALGRVTWYGLHLGFYLTAPGKRDWPTRASFKKLSLS